MHGPLTVAGIINIDESMPTRNRADCDQMFGRSRFGYGVPRRLRSAMSDPTVAMTRSAVPIRSAKVQVNIRHDPCRSMTNRRDQRGVVARRHRPPPRNEKGASMISAGVVPFRSGHRKSSLRIVTAESSRSMIDDDRAWQPG